MKWLTFSIWYFSIGSLFFLLKADFEVEDTVMWANTYYFWEASKDLFFMVTFLKFSKKDLANVQTKEYYLLTVPSVIYFAIRLLWAIINPLTNLSANHPRMVTIMFTALVTGLIILLCVDLKKRYYEDEK